MALVAPQGIGSFVRQRLLGTEAVYEVLDLGDQLVTCAVVRAPGLVPGTRVRLLNAAVREMARLDAAELVTLGRGSAAAPFGRASIVAP
jgi:hypothetical protein